jgi:hypothetical protein
MIWLESYIAGPFQPVVVTMSLFLVENPSPC